MSPPFSAGVSRKKGKKILALIVILILLGAGAYWWKKSHEAKQNFVQKFDTAQEPAAAPVETADKLTLFRTGVCVLYCVLKSDLYCQNSFVKGTLNSPLVVDVSTV